MAAVAFSATERREPLAIFGHRMGLSKIVSTHLWNTPLNLYQQTISRDSFHSWPGGFPGVCDIGVCFTAKAPKFHSKSPEVSQQKPLKTLPKPNRKGSSSSPTICLRVYVKLRGDTLICLLGGWKRTHIPQMVVQHGDESHGRK